MENARVLGELRERTEELTRREAELRNSEERYIGYAGDQRGRLRRGCRHRRDLLFATSLRVGRASGLRPADDEGLDRTGFTPMIRGA